MKPTLFGSLVLGSLAACTSPAAPETTKPSPPPATQAASAPAQAGAVFDVPALLKLSLKQIEAQLGKAAGTDTPNESENELERTYVRGKQHLVITYNTQTLAISSFFLPAPSPTELVKNCNKLLVAGNLTTSSSAYRVDSLAAADPGQYLGIVVEKK